MPRIDLTGEKIGLLTVKRPAPDITKESGRVYAAWYCDCECGTKDYITTTERLRNPKCRSCGCLRDKHQFKKKLNKIKARKEAEEKYYGDFSYQNSMRKAGVL